MIRQEQEVNLQEIRKFSHDFKFGSAVSAYQVEGPNPEPLTDWDIFLQQHPDIVSPNEIGPQWNIPGKAEADIQQMANLGLDMQRLEIPWWKIEKNEGSYDDQELQRYKDLVDFTRSQGMEVMATMNHFALPVWVAEQGGWESRKTVENFKKYAAFLAEKFSDIPYWITINEPQLVVNAGYLVGEFPPQKTSLPAMLKARHNIIKANKSAFDVFHSQLPDAEIGITNAMTWYEPRNPKSTKDKALTTLLNFIDHNNYLYATNNAVKFTGGNYFLGMDVEFDGKLQWVKMREDAEGIPGKIPLGHTVKPDTLPKNPQSDMGWPVAPQYFYDALMYMHNKFKKPIIVTENGIADRDDNMRSFYILTHLIAIHEAMKRGADVRAYLYWSTIDNLEWRDGYGPKFGLLALDQKTGERTLRKSAELYGRIASSKEIDIQMLSQEFLSNDQQQDLIVFLDQINNR